MNIIKFIIIVEAIAISITTYACIIIKLTHNLLRLTLGISNNYFST